MGFLLDHDSHSQPEEKFKIAEMSSVSFLKNESILFINVCVCVVHVRTLPPVAGTDVDIWCVQVQSSVPGAGTAVSTRCRYLRPYLVQVQSSISSTRASVRL
jgi:hypothetical protein